MGFEYRIAFAYTQRDQVVRELSRLPSAIVASADSQTIEFRMDSQRDGMPDAMASVEDYGLYFCDNGGAGRDCLGRVVARLTSCFGLVQVSELE